MAYALAHPFPDCQQVYALMRKLTDPAGHPFGSMGRATPDSRMYQTCFMAFLQQLGMPGKFGERAEVLHLPAPNRPSPLA